MITYYNRFEIDISDELNYTIGSADNDRLFAIEYLSNKDDYWYGLKYGIRISQNEIEISSVIIGDSTGGISLHPNSYLFRDNAIFICNGNKIYALDIPTLKIRWVKKLDMATCFGIYNFQDDFIVHGEIEISRLSSDGIIKWQFSGRDIFVNINGKREFEIADNKIKLVDFLDYEYILNVDGKLIL